MLEIGVLGSIQVVLDGLDVTPPGDLQRALLVALLIEPGRTVSIDGLSEALWGDGLPAQQVAALQTQVFRLRKRLPGLRIERHAGGYQAAVDGHRLDAVDFEALVAEGFARRDHDPAAAVSAIDRALDLWRGEPYTELDTDDAAAARARLVELRLRAIDERIEIRLAAGEATALVAELEAAALTHPLRERVHAQLFEALAGSGRPVDALRAFDRFRRALGAELGIAPSPEFQARHDAIVAGTVAEPAAAVARPQPPRYPTTLVGRAGVLDRVLELLAAERVVTLLGVGGVGKTRLAAEAATRLGAPAASSVVWCDLASSSPANVIDAVAAQLGVEAHVGAAAADRICLALGRTPALVVLDNCEHVVDEVAALTQQIVATTDGVHVLATSRERLAVDGEHLVPVEPLAVGLDGEPSPAVELFRQRAAAAHAAIDDAHSVQVVTELCTRLGGLPLAIELAAAQLYTLDLATIERELTRSIDLLSGQRRSADRHRSLTAALQWSYDLLAPDEQCCLATVAVFRAAFDTEAAAAVLDVPPRLALAQLRALAERSLLQRSGDRWLMLEPLRQFAADLDVVDLDVVGDRHALHVVSRAEVLTRDLRGADPATVMVQFDHLLPDLRSAHQHLRLRRSVDALIRLARAMYDYGVCRPRNEVLTWGLAAAELEPDDPRSPDMLALVAYSAWGRGDREQFRAGVEVARSRWSALHGSAPPSEAICSSSGMYTLSVGQLEESLRWYEQAIAAADPDDVVRSSVLGLTYLLCMAYSADPRTEATAEWLLREYGSGRSPLAAAWAWYGAGEAALDTDPVGAMAHLQRAVDLARRSEAWFIAGTAGASLASLEGRVGTPRHAVELYRWLLPLWMRMADTSILWTAMRSIAALLSTLGDRNGAAIVLHAVRSTSEGHAVFGLDVARLAELEASLRAAMGDDAFEAAAHEGRGLDAPSLTDVVLRRLEPFAG